MHVRVNYILRVIVVKKKAYYVQLVMTSNYLISNYKNISSYIEQNRKAFSLPN